MESAAGTARLNERAEKETESEQLLDALTQVDHRLDQAKERIQRAASRLTYNSPSKLNPKNPGEPTAQEAAPPFASLLDKRIKSLNDRLDELEHAAEQLERFR